MENALNLFRVAAVTPRVHIGNVSKNCEEILNAYDGLADKTDLVVTPELSLTGYTCADLFNNRSLLNMALKGLGKMVSHTKKYGEGGAALVVGLPFEKAGELFNCAALIQNGQLVAIVPKTYLPNYREFYEKRWFSAREYDAEELEINCGSEKLRTLFGNNIVINVGTDNAVCIGLEVCEDVIYDTFKEFTDKKVTEKPFRRITYADAMMTYGSDKPDLRNPLVICDLTDFFAEVDFPAFKGKPVRGIVANCAGKSKKFFEDSLKFATSPEVGLGGLGYITLKEGVFAGPIAKFLSDEKKAEIVELTGVKEGETLFFICDEKKNDTEKKAGHIRSWLGAKEQLDLISDDAFEFCFIVDFPMYEIDEETGDTIFTHNPFSMPQGGMEALLGDDPTQVLAYQYDLVCNGIELASGAVRNHDIDIMKKAFEIAGYSEEELKKRFNALYTAFQYGAPPHAGMAPGIDRMVMLLTDEEKILEVIAFPLNGNAQDLLLGAPGEVTNQQLEDVHLLGNGSAIAGRASGSGSARQSQGKRSTFGDAQQLNQLSLTEEEENDMQNIFKMMGENEKKLSDIDTENVEEMIYVMPMTNVLREDVRKQPFTRESLLEGAPERNEDSWQVPRLVK